jgi:PTS system nitrogen regulatory IIA component
MTFSDAAVTFDLIIPSMIAANQKQVLRLIASHASKIIGIQERIFADRLIDKEKQSSSAMGNGVAVSHMPIGSLTQPLTVFVRLRSAVDFHAPDNLPVDLICLLLTPERDGVIHLRSLARLSRLLRDAQICSRLRQAEDEKAIRSVLDVSSARMMAA